MNREKKFLEELAERILSGYGGKFDRLKIIFPNRRAGLFFNKALAQLIPGPVWSPAVQSIEDFILEFSDVSLGDRMTLLLDLFEVFKGSTSAEESFENFYFWGEMLLKDFDEADKYLVNTRDLFVSLKNLKEIDSRFQFFSPEQKKAMYQFWSAALENPSPGKKGFIVFWQSLNSIYEQFTEKISNAGYGYQGIIYRRVWDKMKMNKLQWEAEEIIFAGFNALTPVEENIVKWVIRERDGKIYWDLDAFYFDDPAHEAGYFLRKYYRDPDFGPFFPASIPARFGRETQTIRTISASQYAGQVKIAGSIVKELSGQKQLRDPEDTVIVLPDESLLSMLLYALPDSVGKLNITMGYPVTGSSFFSLIEHLLELQERKRKGPEKDWFNHKSVVDILNHPYVTGIDPQEGRSIVRLIQRNNMVLVPADVFDNSTGLKKIFTVVDQPQDIFDYLMNMLALIRSRLESVETGPLLFEKEIAMTLYKFLNRMKESFASRNIALSFSMIRKVIRSYARNEKIPFSGEPLEGLQIMGLMETRNLDFRNVILTGVNEGHFPRSYTGSSFIPHNVRRAFGLPVQDHLDAIYSYLFYRLIQNAENIYLIYNSEDAYNRKAEPSRYIYQLKYGSGRTIDHQTLVNDISLRENHPVMIRKDAFVSGRLSRYLIQNGGEEKFLTPSKLSMYLSCPLTFCYRYVYDVEEKEEVTEDLDAAKFGTIVHKVLEYIYTPFTGRMLGHEDFDKIGGRIDEAITYGFSVYHGMEKHPGKFRFEGKNLLGREIIGKYVKKILEFDRSQVPFLISGLEADYRVDYPLELEGRPRSIRMRGVVDRIDMKDGVRRIIDYKSGRDLSTFDAVSGLFEKSGSNQNKAVFQTFLYALMYMHNHPGEDSAIVTGLYNFKELHDERFDIRIKQKKGRGQGSEPVADIRPLMEAFKEHLDVLLREIFDPAVPFRHAEDLRECFFCKSLGAPSEFS